MRVYMMTLGLSAALALGACGGGDAAEEKAAPMKVEDTAFGPLVGTPKKVEERTDAAIDAHRDSLDRRLEEDEGGARQEEPDED